MAVYKVIQDIEAEDKLVGPLTLKGFIYALLAGVCAFIDFRLLLIGTPLKWLFIIMFGLPMILFGVLASPLGREQPTEVWLLSRLRFFTKPRKRIWNQSGIQQLVTITAPKKPARQLTKNLSQTEVHSRLKALAATLDSRGWAVKNVAVNIGAPPTYLQEEGSSDRLIDASVLPQDVPPVDVHASDDILDEKNNQTAKNFQQMIQKAASERKKTLLDKVQKTTAKAKPKNKEKEQVDVSVLDRMTAHLQHPGYTTFSEHKVVTPGQKVSEDEASADKTVTQQEREILERIHKEEADIHSRAPRFAPKAPLKRSNQFKQPMTDTGQTANMELAQTDNVLPLSVASVQHLANRQAVARQIGPNEVELDLH
jgi:hypothetical protein